MTPRSTFSNIVRSPDGSYATAYGPFILQSALQPIFRALPDGTLDIEAFEGLVRATREDISFPPGQFFSLVAPEDIPSVDSTLRTIHILNTGRLNRTRARIFVNFHPGLYRTRHEMRHEVERIRLAAHEAGIAVDRIVCEISERAGEDAAIVADFARRLKEIGFRIAIDDYGAGNSDVDRIRSMNPDYVKFEASWVRDFMNNSAGFALLKVIVNQFMRDGIQSVFEGLEEEWQVDLCQEIDVALMQGYALARPELAPTSFNETFPEIADPFSADTAPATGAVETNHDAPLWREPPQIQPRFNRPVRTFGKRHLR